MTIEHKKHLSYSIPFITPIRKIFPIPDGIIIETSFEEPITFNSMKSKILNNGINEEIFNLYSYFSLSYHPLNDFRPLVLKKEYKLVNQKRKIIFSDLKLPFLVTYDFDTFLHSFHLLEFNYEEIHKNQKEVDFQNMIQILELQKEDFKEKAFSVPHYVNLKLLCEITNQLKEAISVKITESVVDYFKKYEKNYFIYLLAEDFSDNKKYLFIYKLSINLQKTKKKYFCLEKVKKINFEKGIQNIWSFNYFESNNDIFKTKNYFKSDLYRKKEDMNFLNGVENTENRLSVNLMKFEKQFFEYINRKTIKKFFETHYEKDSILIQKDDGTIHLICEEHILFEINLDKKFFGLLKRNNIFKEFEILGIKNKKINFKKNLGDKIIEIQIPFFKEDLFDVIFQISNQVFDKNTFWVIMKNLFKNNFNNKNSLYSNLVQNEVELLISFFSFLICSNNFQKLGKTDSLDDYFSNFNFNVKNLKFSENEHMPHHENYFNLLINNKNSDFDTILDLFINKQKNQISNKIKKTEKSNHSKIFPYMNVNLLDFNQYKIKFFKFLHLYNEDLRIVNHKKKINKDLTYFLFIYSMFLSEENSDLYVEYYLKSFPEILKDFHSSKILVNLKEICSKTDNYYSRDNNNIKIHGNYNEDEYFNENLNDEIFDIYDFISKFLVNENRNLLSRTVQSTPLFFKNTYNIIKMISLILQINFKNKKFDKNNIDTNDYKKSKKKHVILIKEFFDFFNVNKFLEKRKRQFQIQNSKRKDISYKLFDKIFYFFIKNKIDLLYINSLADGIQYIYKNILRLTRKKISFFLKNPFLPKYAYELLEREDIYMNQLIRPNYQSFRYHSYNTMISHSVSHRREKSGSFLNAEENYKIQKNIYNDTSLNYTPIKEISKKKNLIKHKLFKNFKNRFQNLLNNSENKNLHHSKDDILFRELYQYFDCSEFIRLSSVKTSKIMAFDNLKEEEVHEKLQNLLQRSISKRLAGFIGRGCLDFNSEENSMTEVIYIPEINLDGKVKEKSMVVKCVFDPEKPEDISFINWASFHNGVAAGLRCSGKNLENFDKDSLRTWIDYQGSDYSRYDRAGLLFSLGLQGLFDCFTIADIFYNLKTCDDARIIATLLGLATSKKPRKRVHMDDISIKAFNIHLRFNYNESAEVQITRIVQSAAMVGLGIYLKGMAKKSNSEIMLSQIEAKPINENNKDRECHSLAAGFALGLINLGKGSHVPSIKNINLDERLFRYIEQGSVSDNPKEGYKACNILETKKINTQITAPSALIALTLIHLKKNNKIICKRLSLPNSIHDIIKCNPLTLLLTVLARNLICWDSMKISKSFIENSVPDVVRFLQEEPLRKIEEKFSLNYNFSELDYHNLSLIYHNIKTGTFLALSLKYSGTGDKLLKKLIIENIKKVLTIKILDIDFCTDNYAKEKLDSYSLYNNLSVLCLALGIIMAGCCDTESFKLIKHVMKKMAGEKNLKGDYGFNMAFQMAIGFLFLGNGAYTFGNNDFQIACLLLSIYPVFPVDFNDNKYHLQAFRHFYVLATEKNLFHLIDIDSLKPLKLRVELESVDINGKKIKERKVTPLFYKTTHIWEKLKVLDEDYHSMDYNFIKTNYENKPKFLFVKKKFIYNVEINKIKELILLTDIDLVNFDINKIIKSDYISNFFKKITKNLKTKSLVKKNDNQKIIKYYLGCLYNILKKDKASVIQIIFNYLLNEHNCHSMDQGKLNKEKKANFNKNSNLILSFHKFLEKKKEK